MLFSDTDCLCTRCGAVSKGEVGRNGNFVLEATLWFSCILVGAIANAWWVDSLPQALLLHAILQWSWVCLFVVPVGYTMWRLGTLHLVCPECKTDQLIPVTSKIAQRLIRELEG